MRRNILAFLLLVASTAAAGEVRDRITAMSAADRTAVLGAVIRGVNNYSCKAPQRSRYKGTGAGRMIYIVTCEHGYRYIVTIRDDDQGSMRVLDCPLAESLGLDCN